MSQPPEVVKFWIRDPVSNYPSRHPNPKARANPGEFCHALGPGWGLIPKLHGIATAWIIILRGPIMQHGISR